MIGRASQSSFRPAVALIFLKLLTGGITLATGFRAVSDDDFARVVLAQRFVEVPALDPTGTSWLPLPFWVYGTAHAVFGQALEVARATAVALGCVSVLLVWFAARLFDRSPRSAFLSAAAAAVFPYSAVLGVATVPELPAASLILFGAVTLGSGSRKRALGALALAAACACRYEAWPAALAFFIITAWDAARTGEVRLAACAAGVLLFPLAWLLHGLSQHQDAWFFVARVSAYRSALGSSDGPSSLGWIRTPILLVAREPELVLSVLAMAGVLFSRSRRVLLSDAFRARLARAHDRSQPRSGPDARLFCSSRSFRVVLSMLAIVAFLIYAELRGSTPTHHPERALLPLWLGIALGFGSALDAVLTLPKPRRARALFGTGLVSLAGGWMFRATLPREDFARRASEVQIGEAARQLGVERLLIDAADYGFFAVQAGFGRPTGTQVLDLRDPRSPRKPDPLGDRAAEFLREQAGEGFTGLALPKNRLERVAFLGPPRAQAGDWLLMQWSPPQFRGLNPFGSGDR